MQLKQPLVLFVARNLDDVMPPHNKQACEMWAQGWVAGFTSILMQCCVFVVAVLRKLVAFGVTDLDKNEQASAFMKLVFERLEHLLNSSMYCHCDMFHCIVNGIA